MQVFRALLALTSLFFSRTSLFFCVWYLWITHPSVLQGTINVVKTVEYLCSSTPVTPICPAIFALHTQVASRQGLVNPSDGHSLARSSQYSLIGAPAILNSIQDAHDVVESFRVAIEAVEVPSLAVFEESLRDFCDATKAASSSLHVFFFQIKKLNRLVTTAHVTMQDICASERTSVVSAVLLGGRRGPGYCKDEHRLWAAFQAFVTEHTEQVMALHANVTEPKMRFERIDSVLASMQHAIGKDMRTIWESLDAKKGAEGQHNIQRRLVALRDVEEHVSIARRLVRNSALDIDRIAALLDDAQRYGTRALFAASSRNITSEIANLLWNAEELGSSVREISRGPAMASISLN
ncbi:hypothetical protein K488DRAFT_86706 [Vararia minispora EC-137]|uniref:Uncharacterized protein n=1 Tax=Vararia minispora EC-137 TaxID=1314806 RepID=A0ACB8QIW0_9AGAM|nr:hypothetical protein K488DRAFT_86706 [Vararia minispora EC-137]